MGIMVIVRGIKKILELGRQVNWSSMPGAGLIQFKGIQMNTYYFGKRTSLYIHVYSVYA
jgi:hypothetical protein